MKLLFTLTLAMLCASLLSRHRPAAQPQVEPAAAVVVAAPIFGTPAPTPRPPFRSMSIHTGQLTFHRDGDRPTRARNPDRIRP